MTRRPSTPADRCDVWFARVERLTDAHEPLLSPLERQRRAAIARLQDQRRFTLAAVLLRLVCGEALRIPPSDVPVDRQCPRCPGQHGKPRIPGTGLEVSISHSAAVVAVAVTRGKPVGVDVEQVDDRTPYRQLWHRITDGAAVECARPGDFFRTWVRKESVVKATGEGLRVPMIDVRVTGPSAAPRLLGYPGATPVAAMVDLNPPDGYVGAVTVLCAELAEVNERSGDALLDPA